MTTIVIHEGKKGKKGADGINGTGIDSVNYWQEKSPIAEIIGSEFLSVNRNGEAINTDRYRQEIPVPGDFIKHVLSFNNTVGNVGGLLIFDYDVNLISQSILSPIGTTDAYEIILPDTTEPSGTFSAALFGGIDAQSNSIYRFSVYAKAVSGTVDSFDIGIGTDEKVSIPVTLTSEWQRISGTISADQASSNFSFTPITEGAIIQLFGFNITEGVGLYPYSQNTQTTPRLVPNTDGSERVNENGLLIESSKTNLCTQSQSLDQWEVNGTAVASATNQPVTFFNGSATLLKFSETPSITARRSGLNLTEGQEYAVSFYAVVQSGTVESLSVTLAGGETLTVDTTTTYQRQSFKVTAGNLDSISFIATSGEGGTQMILAGVQIEEGDASSYIPTGRAINTRVAESAIVDISTLSAINEPFTLIMSINNVLQIEQNYLFNIGGELTSYIEDGALYLNGADIADININASQDVAFSYDGLVVKIYVNGTQIGSAAFSPLVAKPAFFYLGASDDAGSNALNGFIKSVRWYNQAMSASDIKLAGVYL